jgi:hypothetical protein
MMGNSSFNYIVHIKFVFLLILLPFFSSIDLHSQSYNTNLDSVSYWRNHFRYKENWEFIISAPGSFPGTPLLIVSKFTEDIVGYIYERRTIPKIKALITSDDGKRGGVPKYSDRSGFGLKIYQQNILNPESELTLTAQLGLHKRQRYRVELERMNFFNGSLLIDFTAQYRYLPNESFYGIGPETTVEDRTAYDREWFDMWLNFRIFNARKLTFHTRIGFEVNSIFDGQTSNFTSITEVYDGETLPGLEKGVKLARIQFGFRFNSLVRPGEPISGNESLIYGGYYQQIDGIEYNFWEAGLDLTQYINIFRNRVLLIRIAGETKREKDDKTIPFYRLSNIGLRETVRGYTRGRFFDRDMAMVSIEYRIPLWHSIDSSLFFDTGQVSNNIFKERTLKNLEYGLGMGFRLWTPDRLIATFQFAVSPERIRFYFVWN